MKALFHALNEIVVVLRGACALEGTRQTLTLRVLSKLVNQRQELFRLKEIRQIARVQKVVEVFEDELLGELAFRDAEDDALLFDTRLHQQLLYVLEPLLS